MTSWKLLHGLIAFWQGAENPVFVRETGRAPVWRGAFERAARASGLALALAGLACYVTSLVVLYARNLLILLLPLMVLWPVVIALTLGPIVVGERRQHTWEILLTTTLALDSILLGKAGGALWWLRDVLRAMAGLVVMLAIVIALVNLLVLPAYDAPEGVPAVLSCGVTLLIPALGGVFFIIDRAQHFALTAAAVLAVGATARSVTTALIGGSATALAIWFADSAAALALAALLAGPTTWGDRLAVILFGPLVAFVADLSLANSALLALLTLGLRELGIRALWRWTLHAARQGE